MYNTHSHIKVLCVSIATKCKKWYNNINNDGKAHHERWKWINSILMGFQTRASSTLFRAVFVRMTALRYIYIVPQTSNIIGLFLDFSSCLKTLMLLCKSVGDYPAKILQIILCSFGGVIHSRYNQFNVKRWLQSF